MFSSKNRLSVSATVCQTRFVHRKHNDSRYGLISFKFSGTYVWLIIGLRVKYIQQYIHIYIYILVVELYAILCYSWPFYTEGLKFNGFCLCDKMGGTFEICKNTLHEKAIGCVLFVIPNRNDCSVTRHDSINQILVTPITPTQDSANVNIHDHYISPN